MAIQFKLPVSGSYYKYSGFPLTSQWNLTLWDILFQLFLRLVTSESSKQSIQCPIF